MRRMRGTHTSCWVFASAREEPHEQVSACARTGHKPPNTISRRAESTSGSAECQPPRSPLVLTDLLTLLLGLTILVQLDLSCSCCGRGRASGRGCRRRGCGGGSDVASLTGSLSRRFTASSPVKAGISPIIIFIVTSVARVSFVGVRHLPRARTLFAQGQGKARQGEMALVVSEFPILLGDLRLA